MVSIDAAEHASMQQIEQTRLAFLLHAAAMQAQVQKGEPPPELGCNETLDEMLEAVTGPKPIATLEIDNGVASAKGLRSWGDSAPAESKYPFEYLLDQDYIYDAN